MTTKSTTRHDDDVRSRVAWLLLFTRCDGFFDYSAYARENVIYLFYTIKIQIIYWNIFVSGRGVATGGVCGGVGEIFFLKTGKIREN